MVPFDSRSPFQTSGLRIGTPAITTRGMKEEHMPLIVEMIDNVISDIDNEDLNNKVRKQVNEMMAEFPVFAW
jgi:glycine hydroxymethyltransferase